MRREIAGLVAFWARRPAASVRQQVWRPVCVLLRLPVAKSGYEPRDELRDFCCRPGLIADGHVSYLDRS